MAKVQSSLYQLFVDITRIWIFKSVYLVILGHIKSNRTVNASTGISYMQKLWGMKISKKLWQYQSHAIYSIIMNVLAL